MNYHVVFDDDCFPISSDWLEYMIDCFDYTGENHFLFLNDKMHQPIESNKHVGIKTYKECGGVFLAYTSKALNEIGYMDSEYSGWGFEHAGWSNRIHKAGLNSAPYLMPEKLTTMLRALDYEGNIESSVSDIAKRIILGCVAEGMTIEQACLSAGKSMKTYEYYRRTDKIFTDKIDRTRHLL